MKINREYIHKKNNGHCAYCGKEITIKQMQVDHVFPKNLKHLLKYPEMNYMGKYKIPILESINDDSNLFPSCRKCNNYKSGMHLEIFRYELSKQIERARKTSVNFRNAERFGLIKIIDKPIIFYFEKIMCNEILED